jgi:PTH2 family peptidyl-tRNA hydrolase
MSIGKMITQACHAAVAANELAKKTHSKQWRSWVDEGSKKVALEAEDFEELQELAVLAEQLELVNVYITDAGYTEVLPGTVTCLAIGPDEEYKINKVTGKLPLL